MIWTVDAEIAREFLFKYRPKFDTILVQINWNDIGGFYYIPLDAHIRCFELLGREAYIKLPKAGINPRGVEISRDAAMLLVRDKSTRKIDIFWKKSPIKYDMYKRWIELWEKD